MKRMLIGAAASAALFVCGPIWAQPAPTAAPPAGAQAAAPAPTMNRMPAGGRATSDRGATGAAAQARHRRHGARPAKSKSASGGGEASQLNAQELQRVQSSETAPMNRMPAGGRATSGGTRQ